MERGPFRVPQSSERRPTTRSESTERPVESQPVVEAPRPVPRSTSRRDKKEDKSLKKILSPLAIAALVLVLAAIGWFVWSSGAKNGATAIDSSKYQAVFFTNGQVYFGKLQVFGDDYMKLTDVYYLQADTSEKGDSENPQKASDSSQNNVQLIKLGDEIHGPEDEMIIAKNQMLFYENLKSDGKVAQSISKYKNQ